MRRKEKEKPQIETTLNLASRDLSLSDPASAQPPNEYLKKGIDIDCSLDSSDCRPLDHSASYSSLL